MTTEQMLNKISANSDFSDCILLVGSFASRKYNLACVGDQVWGYDASGDEIDTTRSQMISDYNGCAWAF
jgi:hypothetical protein